VLEKQLEQPRARLFEETGLLHAALASDCCTCLLPGARVNAMTLTPRYCDAQVAHE
jgi:hypothetical protein